MRINPLTLQALVGVVIGIALSAAPVLVMAQPVPSGGGADFPSGGGAGTVPSGTASGCSSAGGNGCVSNPLNVGSFCGLLKALFNGLVAIAIPIAVLFIIWSGFKFVLAQGNPKQLQKARQNFYYTIIGIGIFLGAWLIAEVIAATVNSIGGNTIISCQ